MSTAPNRYRPFRAAALLAVSAVLLAGCSSGQASSSADAATAGTHSQSERRNESSGAKAGAAPGTFAGGKALPGPGAAGSSTATPSPAGSRIARTASLQLRVPDVARAATSVRTMVSGLDGYVVSEQIGSSGGAEPAGEEQGTPAQRRSQADRAGEMTLSVPSAKLDPALDQLGGLGTVVDRSTSSEDVTSQYVDTESRLRTMRASVDRVRALMGRATVLGQVVQLEGELSRRQADLESLESQLATLRSSVERSTVTVRLLSPAVLEASSSGSGFAAGLTGGWSAFTRSVTGVLTAVGAVLPFAVLAVLVGAPVTWWLRRRRSLAHGRPAVAAQVTGSPAAGGPAAP